MQTYLVELYVPRTPRGDAAASGARARAAAVELAREGVRIDYLRTTFLPDDETCFHLVAAGRVRGRPPTLPPRRLRAGADRPGRGDVVAPGGAQNASTRRTASDTRSAEGMYQSSSCQ